MSLFVFEAYAANNRETKIRLFPGEQSNLGPYCVHVSYNLSVVYVTINILLASGTQHYNKVNQN